MIGVLRLIFGEEIIVGHVVGDVCRPTGRNAFDARQCGNGLLQPLV